MEEIQNIWKNKVEKYGSLSKIIEGLEMVNYIDDYYYNPKKDEIFLSNIEEYDDLLEDEIDELFEIYEWRQFWWKWY